MSDSNKQAAFNAYYVCAHEDPEIDDVCIMKTSSIMEDGSIEFSESPYNLDEKNATMEAPGKEPFIIRGDNPQERMAHINSMIESYDNNLGEQAAKALSERAKLIKDAHGYADLRKLTEDNSPELNHLTSTSVTENYDENYDEVDHNVVATFEVHKGGRVIGLSADGTFKHAIKKDADIKNIPIHQAGRDVIDAMQDPNIIRDNKTTLKELSPSRDRSRENIEQVCDR